MDSSPGGLVMPHLLNWVSLHFPACEEQARYVSSGCTVGYRNGGRGGLRGCLKFAQIVKSSTLEGPLSMELISANLTLFFNSF